jgi:hypothetical protein
MTSDRFFGLVEIALIPLRRPHDCSHDRRRERTKRWLVKQTDFGIQNEQLSRNVTTNYLHCIPKGRLRCQKRPTYCGESFERQLYHRPSDVYNVFNLNQKSCSSNAPRKHPLSKGRPSQRGTQIVSGHNANGSLKEKNCFWIGMMTKSKSRSKSKSTHTAATERKLLGPTQSHERS